MKNLDEQKDNTEYPDFEDFEANTEFKTDFKRFSATFLLLCLLLVTGSLGIFLIFYMDSDSDTLQRFINPTETEIDLLKVTWNNTFNNSLIVVYLLDEGTGSVAENVHDPANYNGTLINSPDWENAKNGTGVCFDGDSAQEYINSSDIIDQANFTVSLWVNSTTDDGNGIISKWAEGDDYSWYVQFDANPDLLTRSVTSSSAGHTVLDGNFHNVVVIANASTQIIYIDGIKRDADNVGAMQDITGSLNIGKRERTDQYFTGCLDEIYIWNRALTDAEAIALNDTFYYRQVAPDTVPVSILSQPPNAAAYATPATITFEVNGSDDNNLMNATLNIWNSTNDLVDSNATGWAGTQNSSTFIHTLTTVDSYKWNSYVCDNAAQCAWAASNRTFTVNLDNTLQGIEITLNNPLNASSTENNYTLLNITFNGNFGNVNVSFMQKNVTYSGNASVDPTTEPVAACFDSKYDTVWFSDYTNVTLKEYNKTTLAYKNNFISTYHIDSTGIQECDYNPVNDQFLLLMRGTVEDVIVNMSRTGANLGNVSLIRNAGGIATRGFSLNSEGHFYYCEATQFYKAFPNGSVYYNVSVPDGAGCNCDGVAVETYKGIDQNIWLSCEGSGTLVEHNMTLSKTGKTFTVSTGTEGIDFEDNSVLYSADDGTPDAIKRIVLNSFTNKTLYTETITGNSTITYNWTGGLFDNTTYYWFTAYNNGTDNYENQTWVFTAGLDITVPLMTIITPPNASVGYNITEINYTYIENKTGFCWGSNNAGATNTTPVAMGTNITGLSSLEGSNTFYLYCNDSSGNQNLTTVTFFWDTLAPYFSNLADQTVDFADGLAYDINAVDVNSDLGQFFIPSNANFTINSSGFATNTSVLDIGSYNVNVTINDTHGNLNSSTFNVIIGNWTIYDQINDSSINDTLWSNLSFGTGSSVVENGMYIQALVRRTVDSTGRASVMSTNITSVNIDEIVAKLTLEVQSSGMGAGDTVRSRFYIFNDTDPAVQMGGDYNVNQTHTVIVRAARNLTAGLNMFDIFINGTYNKTIEGTDNVVNMTSFRNNSGGAVVRSQIHYIYYKEGSGTVLISPNSPSNNSIQVNPVSFNITAQATLGQLQNMTLYINDALNETVGLTGSINQTVFSKNLVFGINNWTIRACNNESSCVFSNNFSVNSAKLQELSQIWDNTTVEGEVSRFELNLTTATFQINSAILVYNNTNYTATIANTGGFNYSLSRNLNIPSVPSETNQSFYWHLVLNDSTEYNTTAETQTVTDLLIGSCSLYDTLILNYTMRDEEDQTILNATGQNTSMEIDVDIFPIGSTTPIIEFSGNFSEINPVTVCINDTLNGSTYRMDVINFYTSGERVTEYHNIQNFTLTNSTIPQHIQLYNLETTKAQEFLITFKDDDFLEVENALIDITRYYVGEGTFKTVELPKTDSSGQTLAHFNIDDNIIYTLIVSLEGEVLATFNNVIPVCDDATTGDCTINLNALSTGIEVTDWDNKNNLSFTTSFDEDNRRVTVTFSTSDGSTATVLINTTRFDRFGNLTVCSDSLTSSSGTLTCNVPASFGNLSIVSEIIKDGEILATRIYEIQQDPSDTFGGTSVFLVLLLLLTIPFMFITSPIAIVLSVIFGVILATSLMILSGGGLFGTASAVLWLIIAGAIIIWQISQRSKL